MGHGHGINSQTQGSMTYGRKPHHRRQLTAPVHSYKGIFMYIDDKSIPVKRVRLNSSSGQLLDAPISTPFLKGPIPMLWLSAAASLPGKTLNLGIAIWWLAGMAKTKTFKLTGKALMNFGISKDAASDALKRLEAHGLIRAYRAPGQRTTVEILTVANTGEKQENMG